MTLEATIDVQIEGNSERIFDRLQRMSNKIKGNIAGTNRLTERLRSVSDKVSVNRLNRTLQSARQRMRGLDRRCWSVRQSSRSSGKYIREYARQRERHQS